MCRHRWFLWQIRFPPRCGRPCRKDESVAGAARRRTPKVSTSGKVRRPLDNRRLAIFDLSDAGRQPMLSPDGQTGVVFNGSIYNFHDIAGNSNSAAADSFTVRYRGSGSRLPRSGGIDDLVRRLRGMFAFAIWIIRRAS